MAEGTRPVCLLCGDNASIGSIVQMHRHDPHNVREVWLCGRCAKLENARDQVRKVLEERERHASP